MMLFTNVNIYSTDHLEMKQRLIKRATTVEISYEQIKNRRSLELHSFQTIWAMSWSHADVLRNMSTAVKQEGAQKGPLSVTQRYARVERSVAWQRGARTGLRKDQSSFVNQQQNTVANEAI